MRTAHLLIVGRGCAVIGGVGVCYLGVVGAAQGILLPGVSAVQGGVLSKVGGVMLCRGCAKQEVTS